MRPFIPAHVIRTNDQATAFGHCVLGINHKIGKHLAQLIRSYTYEAGVRATTDVQRHFARVVDVEPLRSVATASADLIRDVSAVFASRARWLLDV